MGKSGVAFGPVVGQKARGEERAVVQKRRVIEGHWDISEYLPYKQVVNIILEH